MSCQWTGTHAHHGCSASEICHPVCSFCLSTGPTFRFSWKNGQGGSDALMSLTGCSFIRGSVLPQMLSLSFRSLSPRWDCSPLFLCRRRTGSGMTQRAGGRWVWGFCVEGTAQANDPGAFTPRSHPRPRSSLPSRRVASGAQSAPSEAPSCSPFGKKKKYKDKYLAKHSASMLPSLPAAQHIALTPRGPTRQPSRPFPVHQCHQYGQLQGLSSPRQWPVFLRTNSDFVP